MRKLVVEGVGHVKYAVMEGDEQITPFIEIMGIYVKPRMRRKKKGSMLVKKLMEKARKLGITCVYIKVTPENLEYQRFLAKNGFEPAPKLLLQKRAGLTARTRAYIRRKTRKLLTGTERPPLTPPFTVVMAVHNEADLLPLTLPSVYRLRPDEVILAFDRCTDRSPEIAKEIAVEHSMCAQTRFGWFNSECNWQYRPAYLYRQAFREAEHDAILVTAADIILDPQIKTKFGLLSRFGLVSFEVKDYPVSPRNLVKRLLERLLPLGWLSGVHVFSKKAWLATEDPEQAKKVGRGEDTVRHLSIRRKYPTKMVLSDTVHLRPREDKHKQQLHGRTAYQVGRPFWLAVAKAAVMLRFGELRGYLSERQN